MPNTRSSSGAGDSPPSLKLIATGNTSASVSLFGVSGGPRFAFWLQKTPKWLSFARFFVEGKKCRILLGQIWKCLIGGAGKFPMIYTSGFYLSGFLM